jgi:hypothetical protein
MRITMAIPTINTTMTVTSAGESVPNMGLWARGRPNSAPRRPQPRTAIPRAALLILTGRHRRDGFCVPSVLVSAEQVNPNVAWTLFSGAGHCGFLLPSSVERKEHYRASVGKEDLAFWPQ